MPCHEEKQLNGFAVISIAQCPDWELLKALPHLMGALGAALQHRNHDRTQPAGAAVFQHDVTLKILLLLEVIRPWEKDDKESCSAP